MSFEDSVSELSICSCVESFVVSIVASATTSSVLSTGFFSTAYSGTGEPRFVSSWSPWANRHLSPYLHTPFSLKFLHISYFLRTTPVVEDDDTEELEAGAWTVAAGIENG